MTDKEVRDAMLRFIVRRLPLRLGRDRLYVSPEARPLLGHDAEFVLVDQRLTGLEMRLERDCR